MLKKSIKRSFWFTKLPKPSMNPDKHNYFAEGHYLYTHRVWLGRFFIPKRISKSKGISEHKNKSIEIVFEYLRNKYEKDFELKASDYESCKNNTWFVYNIKILKEK